MRVRISANPPLPPVKAWFPLTRSAQTISAFKSTLCTSIPALRNFSPRTLHLSIDGFELLDTSELDILRDGDLICIDVLDAPAGEPTQRPHASRKRKRSLSSPSSSTSESESDTTSTESDTETTATESKSGSDASSRPATPFVRQVEPPKTHVKPTPSAPPPATFVLPGYGKPQTQARNLRRRLKRMHKAAGEDGPVSGANAVAQHKNGQVPDANEDGPAIPALMSLSLRNKNKAKNFKSLINKPLPPKIIFAEQEGDATESSAAPRVMPRLIPPSSRASLPPNMFVTSVDVEAGFRREKRKKNVQIEYGDELEEQPGGDDALETEVDVGRLESIAQQQWTTLAKLTRKKQVEPGMIVGHKGLGINPETYTPEQVLTVGIVTWYGEDGIEVRPLRAVSFSGPAEGEATRYMWDEIESGEWKIIPSK